jgi:hypothetical protein
MLGFWLFAAFAIVGTAEATEMTCVLRHSAVAQLTDSGTIDVHTTSNDSIAVHLSGLGSDTALFDETYRLVRIGADADAIYYRQQGTGRLIIWAYFPKSNTITYAKIGAHPANRQPSSYLMISRCVTKGPDETSDSQ